jgi:phosphoribosyl-ATP pyrophosphohydrolase
MTMQLHSIVLDEEIADPMTASSKTSAQRVDPIHQLEHDLQRVGADPLRVPRTNKLVAAGAPQQAKKMVEEAAELAIEAVRRDRNAAVLEAADLLYNLVVLLGGMNIRFDDVCRELERRRGLYGIAARQQKNGNAPTEA